MVENSQAPQPQNVLVGPFDVWQGIGLTVLLHLLQLLFFWIAFAPSWFIGLTQLAYILPAVHHYRKKGQPGIAQGLVIGAAITFFLNAACFGMLAWGGLGFGR